MFTKFMEWWAKEPTYGKKEFVENIIEYEHEEWKFQTTLVKDLEQIANLLSKEFPRKIFHKIDKFKYRNKIHFRSNYGSKKPIQRNMGLKSLVIDREWEAIDEIWWEADLDEYERVYEGRGHSYSILVRKLKNFIKDNYDNTAFQYTYCKYEDSINIVMNALKDDKDNNDGEISDEVFQKSKLIINKLGRAIGEKQQEIEHIEQLQKEVVRKSLIGRLDNELEFIDKYLEVDNIK